MNMTEKRRLLLEVLYEHHKSVAGSFIQGKRITNESGLSWPETCEAAVYLSDKNYIEMKADKEVGNSSLTGFIARINAYGIDLVEDEEQLGKEFQVTNTYVQNINQVIGAISQSGEASVNTLNYNSVDSFIEKMHQEAKEHISEAVELKETQEKIEKIGEAAKEGALDKIKNIGQSMEKYRWLIPSVTQLIEWVRQNIPM